jgi:hypothetical protein
MAKNKNAKNAYCLKKIQYVQKLHRLATISKTETVELSGISG